MNVSRLFEQRARLIMGGSSDSISARPIRIARARVFQVAGAQLRTQFHRYMEPLLDLLPSLWCHFFLKLDGCLQTRRRRGNLNGTGNAVYIVVRYL
jgi:hypothetical protein